MKVGVIAEGDNLGALVGEDFGHSPYFLIVDLDTYDYTAVQNEFSEKEMAGYKVAEAIASLKVDAVICGGIGMHGLEILQKAGIRVWYDADGTVEENLDDLKRRIDLEKKFEGKQ